MNSGIRGAGPDRRTACVHVSALQFLARRRELHPDLTHPPTWRGSGGNDSEGHGGEEVTCAKALARGGRPRTPLSPRLPVSAWAVTRPLGRTQQSSCLLTPTALLLLWKWKRWMRTGTLLPGRSWNPDAGDPSKDTRFRQKLGWQSQSLGPSSLLGEVLGFWFVCLFWGTVQSRVL